MVAKEWIAKKDSSYTKLLFIVKKLCVMNYNYAIRLVLRSLATENN